jgi:2-polyprenyl-3-methyl-5-hydroxy-6-metoxy-1,4-benzoquinol methylase
LTFVSYFERIWAGVGDDATPERFELRRDFLLSRVAQGERVLDLGCAQGEFVQALSLHGAHAVGADIAAEPLRRARRRYPALDFVQAGATLPFDDGEFAVVWAGEVLEHVQDGFAMLDEVARVLRPGGELLVSTPDHGRWRRLAIGLRRSRFEANFDPRADHVRFFTAQSLTSLLGAAGFEQVAVRSQGGVLLASAVRPGAGTPGTTAP